MAALSGLLLVAACSSGPAQAEAGFDRGVVEGLELHQPTALAWGPDDRLYVAELEGTILAVRLDASGRSVAEVEAVATAEEFNQVLGLTVDPFSEEPVLYVSHNFILGTSDGDPFANEIVRVSGSFWRDRESVITGLPVSLHNHGTNALAFDGQGRLFIAQGGTTSGGVPGEPDDPRWGHWDETPLSAAFLVADIHQPGFDGRITYDREEATTETELVSGDVELYSPGHRNTYAFVIHSNGNIYAIDNGSSEAPVSLDCDTPGPPPDNDPDQINLVVQGHYYGHANRNRARRDPSQCSYVSPFEEGPEDNMLKLIPPSSNAMIEFRGDSFGWEGDLIYAWWSGGEIRRLPLAEDGRTIGEEELIASDFALPLAMVQAPDGTIYIAEFGAGQISYLDPAQ